MDRIFDGFLRHQQAEGLALARESDILHLLASADEPPRDYLAQFDCRGLVRTDDEQPIESEGPFIVATHFPPDYLRRVNPLQVVTWLGPRNVFHPNISDKAPVICLGHLAPGTPLVNILFQVFEIITYNKLTMREDDALNRDACVWARRNQHRFPIDTRPLKRRTSSFVVEVGVPNVSAVQVNA